MSGRHTLDAAWAAGKRAIRTEGPDMSSRHTLGATWAAGKRAIRGAVWAAQ